MKLGSRLPRTRISQRTCTDRCGLRSSPFSENSRDRSMRPGSRVAKTGQVGQNETPSWLAMGKVKHGSSRSGGMTVPAAAASGALPVEDYSGVGAARAGEQVRRSRSS